MTNKRNFEINDETIEEKKRLKSSRFFSVYFSEFSLKLLEIAL